MTYDELLACAGNKGLQVKEKPLVANNGRIKGNMVAIRQGLTTVEKSCVLAEEIGHYELTVGDILDQNDMSKRKQERKARIWSYNKLIGLRGLVNAFEHKCLNLGELATFLDVSEEFLTEAISYYRSKYGLFTTYGSYTIYFYPFFTVLKMLQVDICD